MVIFQLFSLENRPSRPFSAIFFRFPTVTGQADVPRQIPRMFANVSKLPRNDLLFDLQMNRWGIGARFGASRRGSGVHKATQQGNAFDACHVHASERTTACHSFSPLFPPSQRLSTGSFTVKFVAPCHRFSCRQFAR